MSSENDEYFVMVKNNCKYDESGKTSGSSDRVDDDKINIFNEGNIEVKTAVELM
jgi:hypothetical protein